VFFKLSSNEMRPGIKIHVSRVQAMNEYAVAETCCSNN